MVISHDKVNKYKQNKPKNKRKKTPDKNAGSQQERIIL